MIDPSSRSPITKRVRVRLKVQSCSIPRESCSRVNKNMKNQSKSQKKNSDLCCKKFMKRTWHSSTINKTSFFSESWTSRRKTPGFRKSLLSRPNSPTSVTAISSREGAARIRRLTQNCSIVTVSAKSSMLGARQSICQTNW